MLSVVMLSVILFSVVMLNVIMLSDVMPTVAYAECHYAECRGALQIPTKRPEEAGMRVEIGNSCYKASLATKQGRV